MLYACLRRSCMLNALLTAEKCQQEPVRVGVAKLILPSSCSVASCASHLLDTNALCPPCTSHLRSPAPQPHAACTQHGLIGMSFALPPSCPAPDTRRLRSFASDTCLEASRSPCYSLCGVFCSSSKPQCLRVPSCHHVVPWLCFAPLESHAYCPRPAKQVSCCGAALALTSLLRVNPGLPLSELGLCWRKVLPCAALTSSSRFAPHLTQRSSTNAVPWRRLRAPRAHTAASLQTEVVRHQGFPV